MSKLVFVVEYGEGVSESNQNVKVEWCPQRNLDDEGQPKTQFYAEDNPFFLVHLDPGKVRIDRVAATDGMTSYVGNDRQTRDDDLLFTSDGDVSLSYLPAGAVSGSWQGNVGAGLTTEGSSRSITSGWPCFYRVSYSVDFLLYRLFAPADIEEKVAAAGDDGGYTIYVVVYVEAAE